MPPVGGGVVVVSGVALGVLGAAVGELGAVLGVFVLAPGVVVSVPGVVVDAPGVVVAPGVPTVELGLEAPGAPLSVPSVPGACCRLGFVLCVPVVPLWPIEPVPLCALGAAELPAPAPVVPLELPPALPAPDCANAQQPHRKIVAVSKISLRFMSLGPFPPCVRKSKWSLTFRWDRPRRRCPARGHNREQLLDTGRLCLMERARPLTSLLLQARRAHTHREAVWVPCACTLSSNPLSICTSDAGSLE